MHFDSFTIPEGGLQAMQRRKKLRKDSNKKEIRVQEKKRLTFVLFLYRPLWQSLTRDNETPGYARLS